MHNDQRSKNVTKSRSGHTVKLFIKAQKALIQKVSQNNSPPTAEMEIENLILYLTKLFNNLDVEKNNGEKDTLVRGNLESGY